MMKVYRVEREKYIETTLTGIGASMTDGFRWNSLYTRLVYTSESRALAMLEVFVHMDISEDLPADRIIVEIFIPDNTLRGKCMHSHIYWNISRIFHILLFCKQYHLLENKHFLRLLFLQYRLLLLQPFCL